MMQTFVNDFRSMWYQITYKFSSYIITVRRTLLAFAAWLVNRKGKKNDGSIVLMYFAGLGDFVMWLSAARELRALYHDRQIILCCSASFEQLAKATGYFDQIITDKYEGKDTYWSRWKVREKFKKIDCDTLIQCFYYKDYIAATIKARRKMTVTKYIMPKLCTWIVNHIYDEILPFDEEPVHMMLQQDHYLKKLGWRGKVRPQCLPLTNSALKISGEYFVVFPGAQSPERRWNIDNFIKAAVEISQKYHLKCCICGGKTERELADYFLQQCENVIEVVDMVGKTDVLQLIEMIRGAVVLLTNDTSAVHIAVGTKTPSVCVFGLWDMKNSPLPYPDEYEANPVPVTCYVSTPCARCNWQYTKECLEAIHQKGRRLCIDLVPVATVVSAVEKVLEEKMQADNNQRGER